MKLLKSICFYYFSILFILYILINPFSNSKESYISKNNQNQPTFSRFKMNQSFELNNESQLICQYFYCITFVSLYNPTDNLKDIYHIYHRFETLTNGYYNLHNLNRNKSFRVHEFLKAFKLGDTRIFDRIFSRFGILL